MAIYLNLRFGVFLVNCSWFIMLQEVEKDVKARTKGETGAAKTLCSPFDQPELPEGISIVQVEVLTCYYFIPPQFLYNLSVSFEMCMVPKKMFS